MRAGLLPACIGSGLRHQDRFGILATNCLEFYETYAAAEYGGTILVPINYRLAPAEIVHVLRDAGAKGLVFEAQYAATIETIRPQLPEIAFYVRIGAMGEGVLAYEDVWGQGDEAGPPSTVQARRLLRTLVYERNYR